MNDTLITREKTGSFSIIPNEILKDENISLKARGLYATIYSFPDDWELSVRGLASILKEGKDAILTAFKELKTYGYMSMEQTRDSGGHISGTAYHFFNESLKTRQSQKTPRSENPNTVIPNTDYPCSEKPNTENPPQYNIQYNIINKEINKESNKERKSVFVAPDASFQPLVDTWLQYKKERKETYKSPQSIRVWYNNLIKLSGGDYDTAKLIIEQSIGNGWQGIFALRNNNTYGYSNSTDERTRQNIESSIRAKQAIYQRAISSSSEVFDLGI